MMTRSAAAISQNHWLSDMFWEGGPAVLKIETARDYSIRRAGIETDKDHLILLKIQRLLFVSGIRGMGK